MATGLGEGKLLIQTSCRSGEEWALPGYSCPRHAIWVVPNQVIGQNNFTKLHLYSKELQAFSVTVTFWRKKKIFSILYMHAQA